MYFESDGIYHIYNQGNNRKVIFYNRENYLFFLRKIRTHILPFADILAWCLMPNHFHFMVEVKSVVIDGVTLTGGASRAMIASRGATLSRTPISPSIPSSTPNDISLNQSIGIMLASYTRAINLQENTTGSLFRQKTKAICLNEIKGISSNWYTSFGVTFLNVYISEYQYPQACFNYIHANPVKAGLVKKGEDWEFSSWRDLIGMRKGDLVNRERVNEMGLLI